ncbi:MAG: hypothetical protein U1F43_18255 [Myxococcota bacterium]
MNRLLSRALGALAMASLVGAAAPAFAEEELPPGHPPVASGGISLPADIRLHGRFDIAYERYGYTGDIGSGYDAFRNNHHFLFLDRHSKNDPFFFDAELLALTYYQMGYTVPSTREDGWRLSFSAGKVLVPFGSDPLFHHAYGGRVGADQRFLPIVWAEYGLKAGLDLDLDPVGLRVDAFVVRGYAVKKATDVLNLQAGTSPVDDMNFSGGGRVGASLGPASIYYSVYGGTLDHGRKIFMQAFDASLWRLPDVPFLKDIALTLGVIRADVWGGDAPAYYHFADYLQVRWYPTDCFYVQYRAGLDMRDNRQGLFADPDRLDRYDTSAHSVAIGWVAGGFSLTVQHLWQFELRDEQKDDFFRVTATYEF